MDEANQYKERLRIALKAAKICIFEVDLPRQLYTFFENAEAIFGVPGDVILQEVQPFSNLEPEDYRVACSAYFSHPDDEAVIEDAFMHILSGNPATYEARMKAGGSAFTWCRVDVTPIMENGKPSRMVGVITDISDMKKRTDSLEKAARQEDFTGLYKKGYATQQIKQALALHPQANYTLIVLDIDNLKTITDTYGHAVGDKCILELARRLKLAFQEGELSRFGGDEFLVFAEGTVAKDVLLKKAGPLLQFELDGLTCTNSIGIAYYPQDAARFSDLLQKADAALYRAKSSKERMAFYHQISTEPGGNSYGWIENQE